MVDTYIDRKPLCDRWLASWSGNQPHMLLDFYMDDAYYQDPANPDGIRGKKELSDYFGKLLSRNPDWKWETVEIFNTENGFTLKWKAIIPVKGIPLVLYGLDIVEIYGDLISRNEVYFDRVKWLEMIKVGGL
jgi:hypothetical protein